jgi:hypothetical protein
MAENITTENKNNVKKFIASVPDETKRKDSLEIVKMMETLSGYKAKMWGTAIIGFGSVHYKYDSGREGDMPEIGFSPRKAAISFYLSSKFEGRDALLKKFGKHKTAKSCIYVKKLDDIDREVLKKMIQGSLNYRKKNKKA